jgi:hypothetical protein
LGFAAVYDTNQERRIDESVIRENISDNVTQGSQSVSTDVNEESR